ncbi:TPA: hypothetical protein L4R04_005970 [Pseudomonas aeruginosa]|nr:hypothetical protein [Pseudomonas aeruginosa]
MNKFEKALKWFEKYDGYDMRVTTPGGCGDIIITGVLDSCEDDEKLCFVGCDEQEFYACITVGEDGWLLEIQIPHFTLDCNFVQVYKIEDMTIYDDDGSFEIVCDGMDFAFGER